MSQNFHLLTTLAYYSNLDSMLTRLPKRTQEEIDIEKLTQLAIDAATASNWEEAAKINKKIINLSAGDTEALNRLARAQTCAGDVKKAEKTYKKVLSLDPYNLIAKRNLEKITKITPLNDSNGHTDGNGHINRIGVASQNFHNFLYEPGKTKIINLLNLAQPSDLAILDCGQKLELNLKKHGISIADAEGTYLGALPDDLAHKLLAYIAGGNKYEVYVKYATTKSLTVFILEAERASRFTNQPSFLSSYKPSS